MEKILEKITNALSETKNLEDALSVCCAALASVIANCDPKFDLVTLKHIIVLLDEYVHQCRKQVEEQE